MKRVQGVGGGEGNGKHRFYSFCQRGLSWLSAYQNLVTAFLQEQFCSQDLRIQA